MIRETTATKIASSWHGGLWSSLYQLASSGVYLVENHLRYLQEIETCLHPEYNLHPSFLNKKDDRDLNGLKQYIIHMGECNGLGTVYHKHSVYGYFIPFISPETSEVLANRVRTISYLA